MKSTTCNVNKIQINPPFKRRMRLLTDSVPYTYKIKYNPMS